jgi:integrase
MGSLYKRGRIWWIKYYRNGRMMRESSRSNREADAKRILAMREGDIARGIPVTPRLMRVTVFELLEDVKNDYRVNGKRSYPDLEYRCRLYLEPFFGNRRASAVTTAEVRNFVSERQGQGASNTAINRELAALKRAFSLALEAGKILFKPHIPMLAENNIRKGFFEHDQLEALLKQLPEHLTPVVRFAYITGWRTRSEILTLQWKQVDFRAEEIRLDPGTTKNREGRTFPMTQELRELLEKQKAKHELLRQSGVNCPWIFPYEGKPFKSFKTAWKRACLKAGIPWAIPHDFRRTAVRNLVRAGISERVAMQMTGHKTRSVFDRYHVVSEGDLREAKKKLDSKPGTIPGTKGEKAKQRFGLSY